MGVGLSEARPHPIQLGCIEEQCKLPHQGLGSTPEDLQVLYL